MRKLWVDDVRPAPNDTWVWARTIEGAKQELRLGKIKEAALDHDMGAGENGVDLVKWMIDNDLVPEIIRIHSWNGPAARRMESLLFNHCRNLTVRPFTAGSRSSG